MQRHRLATKFDIRDCIHCQEHMFNFEDGVVEFEPWSNMFLVGGKRNVKTTQCGGGGILKTEYVYTEFPPWRRWHSDIDPVVGANTKTTVFSVSKKALLQIDDHHQQHQYLKHLHHHRKFTSTNDFSKYQLVSRWFCWSLVFINPFLKWQSRPERSKWTSFVAKMSPREREMKRSINYKAVKVAGSESTYLWQMRQILHKIHFPSM